jgi:hypothetical protein
MVAEVRSGGQGVRGCHTRRDNLEDGNCGLGGWAKSSLARGASECLICSWPKMQLGIAMRVLREAGGAYGSWQRGPKRPETDYPAHDVRLTTNISQNVLVHHHTTRTRICSRPNEGLNWKLKYRFDRYSHRFVFDFPGHAPKADFYSGKKALNKRQNTHHPNARSQTPSLFRGGEVGLEAGATVVAGAAASARVCAKSSIARSTQFEWKLE